MGGDGTLANDHPGVCSAAEIDDGGGGVAGGWAAVDDEGNFFAELLADLGGVGTLGLAAEIG